MYRAASDADRRYRITAQSLFAPHDLPTRHVQLATEHPFSTAADAKNSSHAEQNNIIRCFPPNRAILSLYTITVYYLVGVALNQTSELGYDEIDVRPREDVRSTCVNGGVSRKTSPARRSSRRGRRCIRNSASLRDRQSNGLA